MQARIDAEVKYTTPLVYEYLRECRGAECACGKKCAGKLCAGIGEVLIPLITGYAGPILRTSLITDLFLLALKDDEEDKAFLSKYIKYTEEIHLENVDIELTIALNSKAMSLIVHDHRGQCNKWLDVLCKTASTIIEKTIGDVIKHRLPCLKSIYLRGSKDVKIYRGGYLKQLCIDVEKIKRIVNRSAFTVIRCGGPLTKTCAFEFSDTTLVMNYFPGLTEEEYRIPYGFSVKTRVEPPTTDKSNKSSGCVIL